MFDGENPTTQVGVSILSTLRCSAKATYQNVCLRFLKSVFSQKGRSDSVMRRHMGMHLALISFQFVLSTVGQVFFVLVLFVLFPLFILGQFFVF